MKRIGPLIFLFVACLLLIRCSRKESDVLKFAIGGAPNEFDVWEELAGEFERKTGIKVDLLHQSTDTDQRRQSLIIPLEARRSDPDIFLMDVAWLGQFAASDWLEPLDRHVRKGNIDVGSFFEKVVNGADRFEGQLMALPVYVDGGLLYFREDLLSRYGYSQPPQTWGELEEIAGHVQEKQRKTNPDFYGFVWQGAQYEGLICNFIEYAASNNGGIRFSEDRIILDSKENLEALEFMVGLIHGSMVSPPNTFTEMKEEEARSFFQRGKALFERNWPYAWSLHQSEESEIRGRIGAAALPHFESGTSVSTLGGWHVGISVFSDKKDNAAQLMKYILSYETQKKLALRLGWNPGRKDVYQDTEVLARMPHLAQLRGVFENAVSRPNLPYYTRLSEVLQKYINAALAGKLTPKKALTEVEREAQKIVERYSSP
ncbi:MAG: ABC transporter substrate-binding protein [Candidatus Zixiibacteriota bacterium]|nr:MAG: ABC transporter substrate-binding protein [candidate division Zixibacteria bacterium]